MPGSVSNSFAEAVLMLIRREVCWLVIAVCCSFVLVCIDRGGRRARLEHAENERMSVRTIIVVEIVRVPGRIVRGGMIPD